LFHQPDEELGMSKEDEKDKNTGRDANEDDGRPPLVFERETFWKSGDRPGETKKKG